MAFVSDNYNFHLPELLNYPLVTRCAELNLLIDRCSLKELQDFFPLLVNSIFGNNTNIGWGLRTMTAQVNPHEFDVLYSFFIPLGPMFRLCYRLLNEPVKFDIPIENLPARSSEMFFTGRYSQFYADMINVDPNRRQIVSLSLNAFDFYIFHFVLHGMVPLHRTNPTAMSVHNEKWKTLYFFLTADYVCSFLPSQPDAVVLPVNVSGTAKISTVMPMQPIPPTRLPKYLKLSALSHSFNATAPAVVGNIRTSTETSQRAHSWRTESVLYLFIDTWLRYDADELYALPSSEFIRVVRILIKQLHGFSNSAELDRTPMATLRHLALPMMNDQIFMFLRCIIKRWPLDSSFSVVLELWLTYIQPWRYSYERKLFSTGPPSMAEPLQIHKRYEQFIKDNMVAYTQIFIQLLPRFERMDFSSIKNVLMMYRLLKVFGQANLSELLQANEGDMYFSKSFMASPSSMSHHHHHHSLNVSSSPVLNRSAGMETVNEWGSYRTGSYMPEEKYVCMFGMDVNQKIRHIIEKMVVSREVEIQRASYMVREQNARRKGFWKNLKWWLFDDDDVFYRQALNDCKKIPDILDNMMQTLSIMFEIELPDPAVIAANSSQYSWDANLSMDMSLSFDEFNSGICASSNIMRKRFENVNFTVDPALVPIRSNEITFLVRFLYQLSCSLNEMFSREMGIYWHRNDLCGRMVRQVLQPPLTVHSFDKSTGMSVFREDRLEPRISLRFLASYQTFSVIFASFIIGYIVFGAPSYGFLILLCCTLAYLFVLSFVSDPK